jgi:hypothetical protein
MTILVFLSRFSLYNFAVKLTESVVLLLSLLDPDVAEVLVLLLVVSDKGAAIVPDIPPVP